MSLDITRCQTSPKGKKRVPVESYWIFSFLFCVLIGCIFDKNNKRQKEKMCLILLIYLFIFWGERNFLIRKLRSQANGVVRWVRRVCWVPASSWKLTSCCDIFNSCKNLRHKNEVSDFNCLIFTFLCCSLLTFSVF